MQVAKRLSHLQTIYYLFLFADLLPDHRPQNGILSTSQEILDCSYAHTFLYSAEEDSVSSST